MNEAGTVIRRRFEVHIGNGRAGHRKLREGKPELKKEEPAGPSRLARLLALAHHFDELIQRGKVKDQAEIARLCHVSRARVTQIMALLYLAPDVQTAVLLFSATPLGERGLRRLALEPDWRKQLATWHRFQRMSTATYCPLRRKP